MSVGHDRIDLDESWSSAVHDAGATAATEVVAAFGRDLVGRWAQPHRRYHDLDHLTSVLTTLDTLTDPHPAPAEVRLAAWFHDAVYDGVPGDDEEASALLAHQVLTELAVPADLATEVGRLVRVTAGHRVADDDPLAALLVDADLAILAAPQREYRRYVDAVRAEYAHLPDEVFRTGRAAVLASLLERPELFRTVSGRRRWEAAARTNLAAELGAMGRSGGPEASTGRL
jgi:predicted metal-dependent HD superfamily phosphohydrolase